MPIQLILLDELLGEETGKGRAIIFNKGRKVIGIIEENVNSEWCHIPELDISLSGTANIISVTASLPDKQDNQVAYYIFLAFSDTAIKCIKIAKDQKSVRQIIGIKQRNGQIAHHLIAKQGCLYYLENESLVIRKLSELTRVFTCPPVTNVLSDQAVSQRKIWSEDNTDAAIAFLSFENDKNLEIFFLIAGEIQRYKVDYSGDSMAYYNKESLKSNSGFIDMITIPNTKIIIAYTLHSLFIYNFKILNPFDNDSVKVTRFPLAKPVKSIKAMLSEPDNPYASNNFILKLIYESGSIEHTQFDIAQDLTCIRSPQGYYKLPRYVQPDSIVLGVDQECTEVVLLSENTEGRPCPVSKSLARPT